MIYIIQNNERFKIGRTNNIKKRLQNLQTGSSSQLLLRTSIQTNRDNILESRLHQLFSTRRILGEWFVLNSDDQNLLIHPHCKHGFCDFDNNEMIVDHSSWLIDVVSLIKNNIENRMFK